jgi:hypothetical protein
MARKSSKTRKTARRLRRRKALDALLTRRVAEAALSGDLPDDWAEALLRGPDRAKAMALVEQLRAG